MNVLIRLFAVSCLVGLAGFTGILAARADDAANALAGKSLSFDSPAIVASGTTAGGGFSGNRNSSDGVRAASPTDGAGLPASFDLDSIDTSHVLHSIQTGPAGSGPVWNGDADASTVTGGRSVIVPRPAVPQIVIVLPEPSAFVLLAVPIGVGLLRRRRRA